MRHPIALSVACLALIAAAVCVTFAGASPPALAAQGAWIRVTPGADVAAAYLTLHNGGSAAVVVVSVSSPRAAAAMIHQTTLSNGVSSMRAHEQLRIAGGETVQLAPGGLHIMLQGLTRPLAPGDEVPLVLRLEDGTSITVTARVRALGDG